MPLAWWIWLLSLLISVGWVTSVLAAPIHPLTGRVNDHAGLLDPALRQRLEQRLLAHDAATGVEVVVLTVESLEGEAIEAYSMRVVESWRIGKKTQDNGVLLLVAKTDRKLRIEVGYGLEGIVPDVVASRIVNDIIKPRFASGDFSGGISSGVDALLARTGGGSEPRATVAPEARRPVAPTGFLGFILSAIAFLGKAAFFGFFVIVMVVFSVLGRLGGGRVQRGVHSRYSPWGRGGGGGTLGGGGFGGGGGSFGGGGASGNW